MYKINRKQKHLIRAYIFLFAVLFIGMNWVNVSWMFNYRVMSALAYGFFNPYQESDLLANANVIEQTPVVAPPRWDTTGHAYPYSEKNNSLEIPVLGLTAPLVIGQSTDIPTLDNDLDNGVVYYPGSVLPGQNGQIMILGHSSPPNWPRIKYDWVFTHINDLTMGDTIILHLNHSQYTYRVIQKDIVEAGQEVGSDMLTGKNNILTLVSCWPPGKDYRRIAIEAELIN